MKHELAQSPKDFRNSASNQVVHIETHLIFADEIIQTGNGARNYRKRSNRINIPCDNGL